MNAQPKRDSASSKTRGILQKKNGNYNDWRKEGDKCGTLASGHHVTIAFFKLQKLQLSAQDCCPSHPVTEGLVHRAPPQAGL